MSNAFKDWIIANMPPTDEIDGMAEEHERLKAELAEAASKTEVYKRELEEAGEEIEELKKQRKNLPFNITKDIMDKVFNLIADKGGYLDREHPIISYDTLLDIVESVRRKYENGGIK